MSSSPGTATAAAADVDASFGEGSLGGSFGILNPPRFGCASGGAGGASPDGALASPVAYSGIARERAE